MENVELPFAHAQHVEQALGGKAWWPFHIFTVQMELPHFHHAMPNSTFSYLMVKSFYVFNLIHIQIFTYTICSPFVLGLSPNVELV